jgi:hypothetical protein
MPISLLQWEQELMLIQMELKQVLLPWFRLVKHIKNESIFTNMLKIIKS